MLPVLVIVRRLPVSGSRVADPCKLLLDHIFQPCDIRLRLLLSPRHINVHRNRQIDVLVGIPVVFHSPVPQSKHFRDLTHGRGRASDDDRHVLAGCEIDALGARAHRYVDRNPALLKRLREYVDVLDIDKFALEGQRLGLPSLLNDGQILAELCTGLSNVQPVGLKLHSLVSGTYPKG